MQTMSGIPAAVASRIPSAAAGGGTKDHSSIRSRLPHRIFDRIKNRPPLKRSPTLPRRNPAHHLRPILRAPLRMKRPLTPSNPLHNQPRSLTNQYRHHTLLRTLAAPIPCLSPQTQTLVISTEAKRSGETPVFALALALAFLSVIPAGNLLLFSSPRQLSSRFQVSSLFLLLR